MKSRQVWVAMLLLVLSCVANAQERPYRDGPVSVVYASAADPAT